MTDFARNGMPTLVDHRGNPLRPTRGGAPHPEAAGLSLPHSWTFVARVGGGNNSYWHQRWDEALRHSREDAEVMRRDAFLMSMLEERKRSVHLLPWELEIPDEKDPFQVEVRDGLTRALKAIPQLPHLLWWWLDAIWYGRTAVQFLWGWDRGTVKGRRTLRVLDCAPIHGDKIGHQFDGTPYVLVDASKASSLRAADLITTTAGGRGLRVVGPWADRILFHQHLIEDMDFFQADQGEAIHGVGVRHKIFWLNFLKLEWLANITDFFSRVGLGITLWEYEAGNPQALAAVKQAAGDQSERAHIFVPVTPDASGKPRGGVQRIEVPTSGADALVKLVQYVDGIIERYMIGQEASSKASASGLGNEASAEFQRDTKRQITAFDAGLAGVSFTGTPRQQGIVSLLKRSTYPEADFPVTWKFNLESGESKEKLDAIKTVVEMGVKVKTDEARKAAGLSKPVDGEEVIDPAALQQGAGGPGGGLGGGAGGGLEGLLGGAGNAPPGGAAEQDGDGNQPDTEQEGAGEDALPPADDGAGSFLASIRHARQDTVLRFLRDAGYGDVADTLRYAWENKGKAPTTPRNPRGNAFLWVGTGEDKGKRRVQISEPGSGRAKKAEGPPVPTQAAPEASAARQPAAKRAAPKGVRPTVEQVKGELEGLDRATLNEDAVLALGDRLLSLTAEDLRELRGQLGLTKGSGPKGGLAAAVLAYVRGEVPAKPVRGKKAAKGPQPSGQKAPPSSAAPAPAPKPAPRPAAPPTARPAAQPSVPAAPPAARPFDPAPHADRALQAIAGLTGRHNLADLVDVRRALAAQGITDHGQQTDLVNHLRRAGLVTMSAREGRHGITEEQHAANIVEGPEDGPYGRAPLGLVHLKPAGEERVKELTGGQATKPAARPAATVPTAPAPAAKPTAAPARLESVLSDHLKGLFAAMPPSGPGETPGKVPIHQLRDWVRQQYGAQAASHAVFDKTMHDLRKRGEIDFATVTDLRDGNPRTMADSIPGVNETFFYVEPHSEQDFDFGGAESKPAPRPTSKPTPPATTAPAASGAGRQDIADAYHSPDAALTAAARSAPPALRHAVADLVNQRLPLADRLDRLADADVEALDGPVSSGAAHKVGIGGNEYLRTVAGLVRTAEAGDRAPGGAPLAEGLKRQRDRIAGQLVPGLRRLGLTQWADWYEGAALPVVDALIGQARGQQRQPGDRRQLISTAPPPPSRLPSASFASRSVYPAVLSDQATRQSVDSLLSRHAETHGRLSDALKAADQNLRSGRGDYKQYQAAEKALDKHRQQARADLAKAAGGTLDVQVSSTNLRGPGAKRFDEGRAFVAALAHGKGIAVRAEQSDEGSKYNEGSRTIYYDTGKGPHDAAHELGHAIEHQVPGAKDAAIAFWQHRVGDEQPRKMADVDPDGNFDDDEEGYQDDFLTAFGGDEVKAYYAGKVYKGEYSDNVTGTEILSMGIEQLYQDPVGFLKADPEYARFVLGCLAGRVR